MFPTKSELLLAVVNRCNERLYGDPQHARRALDAPWVEAVWSGLRSDPVVS